MLTQYDLEVISLINVVETYVIDLDELVDKEPNLVFGSAELEAPWEKWLHQRDALMEESENQMKFLRDYLVVFQREIELPRLRTDVVVRILDLQARHTELVRGIQAD